MQKTQAEEALGMELPTRRVESFHYTDLRSMLSNVPTAIDAADADGDDYKHLYHAKRLPFFDGKFFEEHASEMPEGVTVSTNVAKAKATGIDDTVVAINAAVAGDAIEVTIEGNSTLEDVLGFAHISNTAGRSACYHKVTFKAGAEAKIIDRYISKDNLNSLSNVVIDLNLEENAKVSWFIIQQENTSATRLARMNVSLAANATLNLFILNAGGKLVRQEVKVDVAGEGAHVDIKGVNLIGDNAHIDVTTVLDHNVPNTTAKELFRNVVAGDGHGVFQGQIKVAQIAQKTDAQMACNTLLLTDEGDFSAKPELEIFADDVLCAHGATVTDIDDNHLFYLRARGIKEKMARGLLIKAFVDEVVEELGAGEELEEAFIGIIDAWLDANT